MKKVINDFIFGREILQVYVDTSFSLPDSQTNPCIFVLKGFKSLNYNNMDIFSYNM